MEKPKEMPAFQSPFSDLPESSPLNPAGPTFNLRLWMENLVGFLQRDVHDTPHRTSGVSFKNLNAYGFRSRTDYQKTVGNVFLSVSGFLFGANKQRVDILNDINGVVEAGEMLLVLGRPGSGCSTFLKSISGDTDSFFMTLESEINYQGITPKQMHSQYRGETIYMAENDVHFPALTVSQTLIFAARARAPPGNWIPGVSQKMYAKHMTEVIMSALNLQNTADTKVGNYTIPGISGGEKRRVSIAESILSGSPLQCWDNSTRGLDSAVSAAFINLLRSSSNVMGRTVLVSLYQASEDTYNTFDKVLLLYDGRQIYFGPCNQAKRYFENMGYYCPPRKTTADFLTGITSPHDRLVAPGCHNIIPRSAEERGISPYMLSIPQQIKLCTDRGFQRLRGDTTITISRIVANSILAVVVGTMFINLGETTASLNGRSALIFLAILLNAFASALEILLLYEQRPIVEKQARYGWYHPFAEAVASTICDIPFKICNGIVFNLILYFLTNLRREAYAFFVFVLFSLAITFTLSMVFRTFGAISRSLAQALPFTSISILALMTYTGFVVPIHNMPVWFRWINYLDPIAYAFEALMINEFRGQKFECAEFIPRGSGYSVSGSNHICSVIGAIPGQSFVLGDDYIRLNYSFKPTHLWRNLGIIVALMFCFTVTYLTATELISAKKSKGEVLLFQRGSPLPPSNDLEKTFQPETMRGIQATNLRLSTKFKAHLSQQNSSFQWKDVSYDMKTRDGTTRILHHIDGYIKPGTLTAVMGPSGAGKTTLLNILANRDTFGVTSGNILANGRPRDITFQRKTGYSQQEDITLETMTVREACHFHALMCQSSVYSRQEKLDYADEVIEILDMLSYADAVISVPGEGLNIEQRKKLTIAIELSTRLQHLLFLDEPTSGLDSQSAALIVNILRELSNSGQAIICTIHQPSTFLFEQFDRLLLLTSDGKPAYFGDVGDKGETVVAYFASHGAARAPKDANPAEWLFDVLAGNQNVVHYQVDWNQAWLRSEQYVEFQAELEHIEQESKHQVTTDKDIAPQRIEHSYHHREFAAPFTLQLWECFKRINQHYWRSPVYIYSKMFSCLGSALFLGLTFFDTDNSLQGLQTQTFSIFMLLTQASTIIPQILPHFVLQRSLYEARERPSKLYSWQVFMISNILVELPWNTLMSVFIFLAWYFPIGLWRNAVPTDSVLERAGMMLLFLWVYMMLCSTFGHMVQSCVELADVGANYVNLLFMISLIFCGVLITPSALPHAWHWVNRVVPFTYLVDGVLSVGLANAPVYCSAAELLRFDPLSGQTCSTYMASYISTLGGYLTNPDATVGCAYCPLSSTNDFLTFVDASYHRRWADFGVLWIYVIFNFAAALFLYWLVRVPKKKSFEKEAGHGDGEKDVGT